jgi:hypothetical protein
VNLKRVRQLYSLDGLQLRMRVRRRKHIALLRGPAPTPTGPTERWSKRVFYRCWRHDGERMLATASSPVVGKAMESGAGKIEPLVLPHGYSHLAPMAGVA